MLRSGLLTPAFLLRLILFISLTFMMLGHNLFDRKILLLFFLVLLFFNIRYIINLSWRLLDNVPLLFVVFWCFISSAWSLWIMKSLEEAVVQFVLILTCMMIANTYSMRTFFDIFKKSVCVVVVVNVLSIPLLLGDAFSEIGMKGIYSHKNNLGLAMALSLIVLVFDYYKSKSRIILCFSLSAFVLLMFSLSKTSISLFFFSLIMAYLIGGFRFKFNPNFIISIKSLVMVFLLGFSVLVIVYRFEVLNYIFYNLNEEFMTGRGMLWLTMLLHAENNLIFGFGFNSVWGNGEMSEIYYTDLYETNPFWVETLAASDGGYIDLIVSLGIVGFFVFILFVINTLFLIVSFKDLSYVKILLVLYFFIVFHNFSETTFLLSTNVLWFVFVLISFLASNIGRSRGSLDV